MKKKTGRKPWTKRKEFREPKIRTCASCGRILKKRGPLCARCKNPPKNKNTHCIDCKEPLPKHNIYRGDLRCRACEIQRKHDELAKIAEQAINLYESGFTEKEICILINRLRPRVTAYIRTKYPLYKKDHPNSLTDKDYVEKVKQLRKDGLTDEQILKRYTGIKIKKALITLNMEKYYGTQKDSEAPKRVRLKKG